MNNPTDQAHDRLIDRVLTEAVGGERPPDLSEAIAARVADAKATPLVAPSQSRRAWIVLLTTAASLAAIVLALPSLERPEAEIAQQRSMRPAEPLVSDVSSWRSENASVSAGRDAATIDGRALSSEGRVQSRFESLASGVAARDSEVAEQVADEATPEPPQSDESGIDEPVAGSLATITADLEVPFRQGSFPKTQPEPAERAIGLTPQLKEAAQQKAGEQYGRMETWRALSDGRRSLRFVKPQSIGAPATYGVDAITVWDGDGQQDSSGFSRRRGYEFGYRQSPLGWRRWPEPQSGDRYAAIQENEFIEPEGVAALSTFSIDVDTASYTNVRRFLMQDRRLPPPAGVRIEELVNYFEYGYRAPGAKDEDPFTAAMEVQPCPWKQEHQLVRIGIKGREIDVEKRPLSNLVFLVDVSGSMNEPNKLPLVVEGLKALTERLGENDRVAIVVYAGNEGLVLPSTSGVKKDAIRSALGRLQAGGSTAGGDELRADYEIAERNKIPGGVNRVVLCTDGDFNVGLTGTEELAELVEKRGKEQGVFLTVLGFGRGNLNDAMLETISGRGDGHYAYIDSEREARRVLSRDLSGTLVTIAKDVKLQVEFNPAKVARYRLIGYENRVMAAKDFNDDTKDAGEIGAGHTVTALYEVVPVGVEPPASPVDGLKYQDGVGGRESAIGSEEAASNSEPEASAPGVNEEKVEGGRRKAESNELLTLKIRYKQPEGGASKKLEFPLTEWVAGAKVVMEPSDDFRWAAAVAEFGMLLRNSRHAGDATYEHVLEAARGAIGEDPQGYRAEFLDLVRRAQELSGRE